MQITIKKPITVRLKNHSVNHFFDLLKKKKFLRMNEGEFIRKKKLERKTQQNMPLKLLTHFRTLFFVSKV